MYQTSFLIDTLVKIGVIIALLIATFSTQQYSYYAFLRWLVMISSIYFAFIYSKNGLIGLPIFFGATALLFNPLIPFWFQKSIWQLIDFIIAVFIGFSIYSDWNLTKKSKGNE